MTNTLAYYGTELSPAAKKFYEKRGSITDTLYSSQLMNSPNKLECYITLGLIRLSGTNALAYRTHLKVKKRKLKCRENHPSPPPPPQSNLDRVTRLGEISPFGRFFMVLGEFFFVEKVAQ